MLTRNLYREDEVEAALLLCLSRGRAAESAFWATELIDSDLGTVVVKTVFRAWLWFYGVREIEWFAAFATMMEADELDADLLMAAVLGFRKRDASIVGLLAHGLGAAPTYYADPFAKGKTRVAWGLCVAGEIPWNSLPAIAPKHSEKLVQKLLTAEEWFGGLWEPEFLWHCRAAAVALICCPTLPTGSTFRPIPGHIQANLAEWSAATGRARRAYKIPVSCLYLITARGRDHTVYDGTEAELMGKLEPKLKGSSFWEGVVAEIGGWDVIQRHDETREEFYDTYFPDDIPDEWSLEERAKSHGRGVLQRGATAEPARFIQTWFYGIHCYVAWGGIRKLTVLPSALSAVYTERLEELKAAVSKWDRTPRTYELTAEPSYVLDKSPLPSNTVVDSDSIHP
jgi:hypothetical protein